MTTPKRRSISKRTRVAYHEAGHSVLSASINDAPSAISIVQNHASLGRARYRFESATTSLVQVFLAGFASEHVVTGVRPRRMATGLGLAVLTATLPGLDEMSASIAGTDEALAVQALLKLGTEPEDGAIRTQFDRFYEISRESVISVWGAVQAVAKALLKHNEFGRDRFFEVIEPFDIYKPVRAVQRAHGVVGA